MRGRALPGILAGVILLAGWQGFAGSRAAGPIGSLVGQGTVRIGGQPAPSGTAVFAGDVVVTEKGSVAVVTLRSGDTAGLAPESELSLTGGDGKPRLSLRRGALVVRAMGVQPVHVEVLGTPVSVQGEGGFPAICSVAAVGRSAAILNEGGRVEIHGAGAPLLLPKGKSVQWEAGHPQAAGQLAGKVNRAIPEETVQHSGQTNQLPLKLDDPVNWEDWVRTFKNGRVQIKLLDGSMLNVGARSELRVTKHDPTSGQTAIEMTVGRMRADVVKLTDKPNGSFQVRTQSAVIGVVGTTFIVWATDKFTHVWCIEGQVTVQGVAAAAGQVTLGPGQQTHVPAGGSPGAPAQVAEAEVQAQMALTDVTGPAAMGHAARVLTAGRLGAAGVATIVSGVAISRAGSARNLLDDAASSASSAVSAASSAVDSAAGAVGSLTNVSATGAGITAALPSPSAPGCGCQ